MDSQRMFDEGDRVRLHQDVNTEMGDGVVIAAGQRGEVVGVAIYANGMRTYAVRLDSDVINYRLHVFPYEIEADDGA